MVETFANSGDPDQTPRFAASDLGLHCLPSTSPDSNGLDKLPLNLLLIFILCRSNKIRKNVNITHDNLTIINP